MHGFHDTIDFKIFVAIKMSNGYDIVMLPQPLTIQCEVNYARLYKEYLIEWNQDINKAVYSDRSNFLIIYMRNIFNKKIDIEIAHVVSLDYCTNIPIPITYGYRCTVVSVLTPDEEMVLSVLNDHFKTKTNKLHGNDIDIITVDELPNESDNMDNTLLVLRNGTAFYGTSIVVMPAIADIYYNAPHTTVKWSDGTVTTVAATSGEEFNKELGLAMAISRKYCECMGFEYPRAEFKRMVNNAHDQTAKTAMRKEYKNSKKLLKAADISSKESDDHGFDSNR